VSRITVSRLGPRRPGAGRPPPPTRVWPRDGTTAWSSSRSTSPRARRRPCSSV